MKIAETEPQIAVVRAYLVQTYGKEVDMPELELIP